MCQLLPSVYQGQEINCLTLAYFAISALDLLDALDCVDKEGVIGWVLSLHAHPKNEAEVNYGFNSQCCRIGGRAAYCTVASLRLMGFIEDDLLSKSAS
ncbi:hypothetical protein F0562_031583 [Nyssa sinensis]|uniref:Prenyltransferase alpha-alpha toroid domain-containing protein n=1 Tax=Nyssa sinensis TaxID=561372 RepID=A0A5J5AVA3_9ASTE|nr:hypothetical protein F0562_031583 [Nyssa sinensis]